MESPSNSKGEKDKEEDEEDDEPISYFFGSNKADSDNNRKSPTGFVYENESFYIDDYVLLHTDEVFITTAKSTFVHQMNKGGEPFVAQIVKINPRTDNIIVRVLIHSYFFSAWYSGSTEAKIQRESIQQVVKENYSIQVQIVCFFRNIHLKKNIWMKCHCALLFNSVL